jgi:hypothetical protein
LWSAFASKCDTVQAAHSSSRDTPEDVKAKFRKAVLSQSIATSRQKAELEATITIKCPSAASGQLLLSAPQVDTDVSDIGCAGQSSAASSIADNDDVSEILSNSQSEGEGRSTSTSMSGPIMRSFFDSITQRQKAELDSLWAKACYTNMWSFNSTKNPYLCEFIQKIRPSYKLPTSHALANQLLDDTYVSVNTTVQEALTKALALTMQLDGWSDINRASIINVALYAGSPIFLKSIDPGINRHDAKLICETVITAIDGLGEAKHKVKAIVTDQPTVMTAAWKLIEEQRPSVSCYGCAAHVINLLAGDFRKMEINEELLEKNKKICRFFKSHSLARELLQAETKQRYGAPLSVVISCATKWSTDYFMLRRNLRIKAALTAAAVEEKLARDFRGEVNADVKRNLLDENFWEETERVAMLLHPLSTGIRYAV